MSTASAATYDLAEQQQAFVGLLTRPLLTPFSDPELHRIVVRHRAILGTWAARAGYRLVAVGTTFRLRRVPIDQSVAIPAGPAPARRELVLSVLAAACLEDLPGDSVTIQQVSDSVRDLSAVGGVTGYDPDRRAERIVLVRALARLADLGVLRRRTDREDLVRRWEDDGQGVGAGYAVNREALLLLVDPTDIDLALRPARHAPSDEERSDTRGPRLLRTLLETQALLVADLSESEQDYLRARRSRLVARAAEMTGGTTEIRAEGLLLVLPADTAYAGDGTVAFPAASAVSWVSLHLLDAAVAFLRGPAADGANPANSANSATPADSADPTRASCPTSVIEHAASRLHASSGDRLTVDLRSSPERLREAAEDHLSEAGLLSLSPDGDWLLPPTAARFRSAVLTVADPAQRREQGQLDSTTPLLEFPG